MARDCISNNNSAQLSTPRLFCFVVLLFVLFFLFCLFLFVAAAVVVAVIIFVDDVVIFLHRYLFPFNGWLLIHVFIHCIHYSSHSSP